MHSFLDVCILNFGLKLFYVVTIVHWHSQFSGRLYIKKFLCCLFADWLFTKKFVYYFFADCLFICVSDLGFN